MKRFLMLVGVAVVAAAMYVAASPASRQSSGPTAKQFKALKTQVTSLSKTLKQVKTLAVAEAVLLTDCDQVAVPIDQFGDGQNSTPTQGYEYSPTATPGSGTVLTTALDVSSSSDAGALYITGGDATCANIFGGNQLRSAAAKAGVRLHPATHLPAFTAHGR
jgi:mannose-1-phosphate guanylyltransferase